MSRRFGRAIGLSAGKCGEHTALVGRTHRNVFGSSCGWRRTAAPEQVRGREGRDRRQGPLVELRVAVADRHLSGAQGPRRLGHGERSRLQLLRKLADIVAGVVDFGLGKFGCTSSVTLRVHFLDLFGVVERVSGSSYVVPELYSVLHCILACTV